MSWSKRLTEALATLKNLRMLEFIKERPVSCFITANVGIFMGWRLNIIPETFMVKHFSYSNYNMEHYRWYTVFTHSLSHQSIFSLLFDSMTLFFIGKAVDRMYGRQTVRMLMLMGIAFSGLAMCAFYREPPGIVVPQIGSDGPVCAMLTFYGLSNLQSSVLLFVFPVKMWVLLTMMGFYAVVFDPSKKNFGGMLAGLLAHRMKMFKFA